MFIFKCITKKVICQEKFLSEYSALAERRKNGLSNSKTSGRTKKMFW